MTNDEKQALAVVVGMAWAGCSVVVPTSGHDVAADYRDEVVRVGKKSLDLDLIETTYFGLDFPVSGDAQRRPGQIVFAPEANAAELTAREGVRLVQVEPKPEPKETKTPSKKKASS